MGGINWQERNDTDRAVRELSNSICEKKVLALWPRPEGGIVRGEVRAGLFDGAEIAISFVH